MKCCFLRANSFFKVVSHHLSIRSITITFTEVACYYFAWWIGRLSHCRLELRLKLPAELVYYHLCVGFAISSSRSFTLQSATAVAMSVLLRMMVLLCFLFCSGRQGNPNSRVSYYLCSMFVKLVAVVEFTASVCYFVVS